VLDGEITYTAKELEEEAALPKLLEHWRPGPRVNRSDLLALLHRKLGLQIIADHYSQWYPWEAAQRRSVREILQRFERYPGITSEELEVLRKWPDNEYRLKDFAERYPEADWGWDGELLYMRARDVVRMDAREIPNRFLRRWQAASAEPGYLGLDELAEVQLLTDEQLDALRKTYPYLGLATEEDALNRDLLLRFYGLLSLGQRKELFDQGLSARGLTPPQKAALEDVVVKLWDSAHEIRRGCRVGVYDNAGRRVDKPVAALAGYPESIQMEITGRQEHFFSGRTPAGKTLEEALRATQTERDRGQLRKGTATEYQVTLKHVDGSETRDSFNLVTYVPIKQSADPHAFPSVSSVSQWFRKISRRARAAGFGVPSKSTMDVFAVQGKQSWPIQRMTPPQRGNRPLHALTAMLRASACRF
jgi:hypothetical protein